MLKKTITYTDYLGTTRVEDRYFNLSKSELSDMQMSVEGGLDKWLDKIMKGKSNREIYNTFVEIVDKAYGELSPDGKYHLKEDEEGHKLYKKFKQSPAYDALMDDICQNESTIAEFCKGILPKNLPAPEDHKQAEIHPINK